MAPSTATTTGASLPAHPPVPQRQMSNTNPSSRPTTPQNAGKSRSARQRKDQPAVKDAIQAASSNVVTGPTPEASLNRSEPRQARNKPLPTASQLRQMGSDNSVDTRPRGIINLPKQELNTPPRSKSRSARTPSAKQKDVADVLPPSTTVSQPFHQPVDKKRSRPPKNAKGRPAPASNEMTTEDDVFSAGIHPPSAFGKLETPNKPSRRPRHHRTVSEPFSVLSGNAGDDSFVPHDGKVPPGQGNSRRKRREKDKDKDKDKGGDGERGGRAGDKALEVPLASALGNLHVQADTDADSDPTKLPPKRTGLRLPLTEEDDDGDSTISDTHEAVGVSDDSGVAFDRSHRAEQSSSGLPLEILNNAGARLLHELRSLSQSAPGGKSYLTDHTQPDDGYGSGSGYGSGQGQRSGRQGREAGRRQPVHGGGRGDVQDESAVWDMPGLQERGSGTDLTWQQSLLASPAANLRIQTPRRARDAKPSTPSAGLDSNKRNPSTKVTQGFTPSKSQMRDQETFGTASTSAAVAQYRKTPSGFATPMKHTQRLQNATDQRPLPHHTMSAPPNGFAATEPVRRLAAEEVKVYAGPTFHNSPSADSLPAPRMKGA